jgi:hypothetical protein
VVDRYSYTFISHMHDMGAYAIHGTRRKHNLNAPEVGITLKRVAQYNHGEFNWIRTPHTENGSEWIMLHICHSANAFT